jgi:hypothetical protein
VYLIPAWSARYFHGLLDRLVERVWNQRDDEYFLAASLRRVDRGARSGEARHAGGSRNLGSRVGQVGGASGPRTSLSSRVSACRDHKGRKYDQTKLFAPATRQAIQCHFVPSLELIPKHPWRMPLVREAITVPDLVGSESDGGGLGRCGFG